MTKPEELKSGCDAGQNILHDLDRIKSLIEKLSKEDGMVRESARRSLVDIGGPAAAFLVEALPASAKELRWEIMMTLADIGDPMTAGTLVKALEDKVFDIRWLAAEGLIKVGREGITPLLQALIERSDSPWLRQGAHHVLHDTADPELKQLLKPVMEALEHAEAAVETPGKAKAALEAFNESEISYGAAPT